MQEIQKLIDRYQERISEYHLLAGTCRTSPSRRLQAHSMAGTLIEVVDDLEQLIATETKRPNDPGVKEIPWDYSGGLL